MSRDEPRWGRPFRIARTEGESHVDSGDWCPLGILTGEPPSIAGIQAQCHDRDGYNGGPAFLACLLASVSYWFRVWLALYAQFREIDELDEEAREAEWETASLGPCVDIPFTRPEIVKTESGWKREGTDKGTKHVPFLPYHLDLLSRPYFDRALELLAADRDRAFLDAYRSSFDRVLDAVQTHEPSFWRLPELEKAAEKRFDDWRGFPAEINAFLRDTYREIARIAEPVEHAAEHVPVEKDVDTGPSHSTDFTSVTWFGTTYTFTRAQARCIALLWAEWEKGGHGLHELTIGEKIQSDSSDFRLTHTFRSKKDGTHPAWETMIEHVRPRTYRLRDPNPGKTPG